MRRSVILRLGAVAVVLAVGMTVTAGGDGAKRLRWEYRVLSKQQVLQLGKQDLAAGLNSLGKQGWELVGLDGAYIFKRPGPTAGTSLEDLKQRVAQAESDVEAQREHMVWSELMARKGLVSDPFVLTEHSLMKEAQAALEQARRDLDSRLLPAPKQLPQAAPKK